MSCAQIRVSLNLLRSPVQIEITIAWALTLDKLDDYTLIINADTVMCTELCTKFRKCEVKEETFVGVYSERPGRCVIRNTYSAVNKAGVTLPFLPQPQEIPFKATQLIVPSSHRFMFA